MIKISSSLICPNGYNLLMKNRWNARPGGGVAVLCRSDQTIKKMEFQSTFECLWCEIEVKRSNKYHIVAVYHPPDPVYAESKLLDHLFDSCERILTSVPCARTVIAGDVNQLIINVVVNNKISNNQLKSITENSEHQMCF